MEKRGGCEIASTLPASEIYRVALLDLIVHVHLGSTDSMTKSIRDSNMPAKNIEWAFFNWSTDVEKTCGSQVLVPLEKSFIF